jgi:ABC-type multidrug transport system fused ATPase/permease subunit
MNLGLDTEIGERGVNLSGGQKQRVAIARACYSDRPIILLDDCLSALDVNTEDKLNEVLFNSVWKNKIRILVTHRLSILSKCDKVLFIRNGKIIENGSFNEIYNRSESVRDFVSSISP